VSWGRKNPCPHRGSGGGDRFLTRGKTTSMTTLNVDEGTVRTARGTFLKTRSTPGVGIGKSRREGKYKRKGDKGTVRQGRTRRGGVRTAPAPKAGSTRHLAAKTRLLGREKVGPLDPNRRHARPTKRGRRALDDLPLHRLLTSVCPRNHACTAYQVHG